jgi:CheY-like chemotaxis protein
MHKFNSFRFEPNRRKKIEEECDRLFKDGQDAHAAEALNRMKNVILETFKPAQVKEQRGAKSHRLDGVRVLLVDDSPDILYMLKTVIFEKSGAEVITAVSVKDALKVFESYCPDVLISDIEMPDQDGYELIRQVRGRGADRGGEIPAAALTGSVSESYVRALASGFQLCLGKPIEPDALIAVIVTLAGCTCSDLKDRSA